MRKIVVVSVLIAILTIALLGLMEGTLRIWGPNYFRPIKARRLLPWKLFLVNAISSEWRVREGDNRQFGLSEPTHINSRGLRNLEIPLEPKGVRRMPIVGGLLYLWGLRLRSRKYKWTASAATTGGG